MKKIAIICSPGNDNHLDEVSNYLKDNYEVKMCLDGDQENIFNSIKWADVVWIEWADSSAVNITRFEDLLRGKQVILRLHSYEVFTDCMEYIKWELVTDLILIADSIKDILLEKYPAIKSNVNNIHVIPNGIDTEKFKVVREKRGKKLAYLGYLNFKKCPVLLFATFAELLKVDPDYSLHIAGSFQEERYRLYFEQMKVKNPLFNEKVIFYDWVDKPNEWLKDKSHIVCASVLESQGKGIMEAMSMGLKPIIHDFVGADSIYPKEYLWNTASEFIYDVVVGKYEPKVYNEYIRENYNTKNTTRQIGNIIDSFKATKKVLSLASKEIKLSAIIMMRDEEKHIGRCLKSIQGIVDEIIIVDTGSKDKSMEIAKEYGAKIYEHPWEDNFSIHRNQTINYATGDWLLSIDADEELVGDKKCLKDTLSQINEGYNGVSVKLTDVCEEAGTQFNALRIFRSGTVKYKRAVHNIAIYDGMDEYGTVLLNGITLIHHGSHYQISKKDSEKKLIRTKTLLKQALLDDPDDYDLLFYLMQLYGTAQDYKKAIEYGEKYLFEKAACSNFNNSVYYTMVRLYIETKSYQKAYDLVKRARVLMPNDIDISFVMTELGIVTRDGNLLLDGARNYIRQYDFFSKSPEAKGGRFIFSFKPESLFFVTKHMTAYLLGDAVNCLGKLKETVSLFPKTRRQAAVEEINEILEPIGIQTN